MSDIERIERRLSAVERAVVDGDIELDELADIASVAGTLEELTAQLEEHERRLAALEGRTDALDGAVGSVDSVNEAVERRADAAVAAVDRLEYRLDDLERAVDDATDLDADTPRSAADGITSENLTEDTETDGAGLARDDRDPVGVASEPTDASESVSGPPAVERTVSEIVSPSTERDSESGREGDGSDGDTPDGHSGGLSDRDGSTAREPRTTAGATQAALDDRLSDSADPNGAAGSDSANGTSRVDDAHDAQSDGDEESTGGVLQSLRARLP